MGARTAITILSENTAGPGHGILGEHGFSALIQRDDLRLLFDTGAGHVLLHNAARLRQDLGHLDGIALSHGHYDHTGGLFDVLALQPGHVPVYAHPGLLAPKYSVHKTKEGTEERHYVGMPWPQEALEVAGAQFSWGEAPRQITDGVWLSGEIARRTPFESVPGSLQVRQDGRWVQDELRDEQSLFLRGGQGLIVLLGCAHPGMINIIEQAIRVTGIAEVQAVIGGTHLVTQNDQGIAASIAALKGFRPQLVGTAHCTGIKANARIALEFGDAFRECRAGTVLELE